MNTQWHAIYTHHQCERKICERLDKQNVVSFLPTHQVYRIWSDRKKKIEVPLFSNYVFVKVEPGFRYKVLQIPGVTRFIAFNNSPVVIPEKDIDDLKLIIGKTKPIPDNFFAVGDSVRIVRGPLTGLEGILMEQRKNHRFLIRFTSIQQAVSVDIDTALIEQTMHHA
jgi:transcription antitermination factor NusG